VAHLPLCCQSLAAKNNPPCNAAEGDSMYLLVTITVGLSGYDPIATGAAVATLQGTSIDVTLTGLNVNFNPPPPRRCATTSIGPLAVGRYYVRLFLVDGGTNRSRGLIAASFLTVTPDPSAVPTISHAGIGGHYLVVGGHATDVPLSLALAAGPLTPF
jgi:hypothetical protein